MTTRNIIGAGGGKGGGGRAAVEAKDSLRSSQYATVVDVISEGEIVGLVNGAKSIYLDGVPVEGPSGAANFEGGVSYKVSVGTQVQDPFPFAPVAVTSEVNIEVKNGAPVVRTVSNPEIDWVVVTLSIPQLTNQDKTTGDINGSEVSIAIDIDNAGGGYQTVVTDTIKGKTSSAYQRQYKLNLPGNGPWAIRMRRLSADSSSMAVQNKTYFASITEGIDVKLMYSNTAACGLRVSAEKFNSVPTRGYHVRGMVIRVPSNYNPETRQYTGVWDGTFKNAYSNNPAWCFYDIVTKNRYGLGDFIGEGTVSKWQLYAIGRYCDELVPNGFGGTEPRFTCNLYLQTREDAYKVLTGMASIFRGMTYWADAQLQVVQDAPATPRMTFTDANVIDGMFNYEGADRRARHTVALVSWNDPGDMYRQKIEYVENAEAIQRWGVIESEILAVGCTSRGQAHRAGKWLLYTEQFESETLSFKAGMDAARLAPGDIIEVQDSVRGGRRNGGRCMAGTTTTQVALDAPVLIEDGQGYMLSVMMPSGQVESRAINNTPGETTLLTLAAPLSEEPVPNAIWVMSATNLSTETWRVISVKEAEPTVVEVTAVYHHPGKFAAVEDGLTLEPVVSSQLKTRPEPITHFVSNSEVYQAGEGTYSTRISMSWRAPDTAVSYDIQWRRGSDNFRSVNEIRTPGFDIENAPAGTYTIRVIARNALGRGSEPAVFTHVVEQSGTAPDVENLRLNPNFLGQELPVTWDPVPGAQLYEVEVRTTGGLLLRTETVPINEYTYSFSKNLTDGPNRALRIRVRAKTALAVSANWTQLDFSNPAPGAPFGLVVEPGPGQVAITANRPADPDFQGMIIWMSSDPTVPTLPGNIIYDGSDNAYVKTGLQPGLPMHFRVAFYDVFGKTGLNASSSLTATPTATGGVMTVTSLPADPSEVSGELALFLDVSDLDQRGLYGWNGTEWVSTSEILDGSVTSAKLAIAAVQAKNLSVQKHFIY